MLLTIGLLLWVKWQESADRSKIIFEMSEGKVRNSFAYFLVHLK
jgi:hypothetical protein